MVLLLIRDLFSHCHHCVVITEVLESRPDTGQYPILQMDIDLGSIGKQRQSCFDPVVKSCQSSQHVGKQRRSGKGLQSSSDFSH